MNGRLSKALEALTRVDGVRGAIIVDAEAGVPVQSRLAPGVRETALAALAGILYSRTDEASGAAGFGTLKVLQLQAEGGHLVVTGSGALLVVVLTEPDARMGLVRVQATRAARELGE